MSVMTALEKLFSAQKPAQNQQQQPAAQNTPAPTQDAAMQKGMQDPNNPANKGAPASAEKPAEPIWKQDLPANPAEQNLFNPDMDNFQKAVQAMNFTKNIDPQLAQKALGGDAQALMQLLNTGAQGSFAAAMTAAQQLVESGIQKRTSEIQKDMETRFRTMSASDAARTANPSFKDPEVAPIFDDVQKRFAARFPEASPSEVAAKSQEFLTNVANKILENSPQARESKKNSEQTQANSQMNWLEWGGEEEAPRNLFPS